MEYNLFKGLITHVIDPSNFWMRIGNASDLKLFQEYKQRLDAFYNEGSSGFLCNIDQMCPGYLVVVAHSSDDSATDELHWERAKVTRVDRTNNTADVFFVDLGYTAIVTLDECRDIPFDLFNYLAPQSVRMSLAGIKPLSKSWTSRASSLLQKQTKQEVVALLIHYDDASGCFSVVIYTKQSSGVWQSLIHEMQHNELALGTADVNIEEFLTDDLVEECLQRTENGQNTSDFATGDQDEIRSAGDGVETNEKNDDQGSSEMIKQADSSSGTIGVSGFDYRTLLQTRSISISKMQLEKGLEAQEQMKLKLMQDLQRMDSDPSQHDEQDWDDDQNFDFHSDIVSQIHQGAFDRQYSDDGLRGLIEESRTLDSGPKKANTQKLDIKQPSFKEVNVSTGLKDEEAVSHSLNEIESYQLEKQIKEILSNKDEKESDFICASVYGVVEPDVDAPSDLLRAVICAILEHVIENSCQHSEVAFAILETYSDSDAFGKAVTDVIKEIKDRFVKKPQSLRLEGKHQKFSQMLAHIFMESEEWNSSVCQMVQKYALSMVERWIIFNKQRQQNGDELINLEFIYLQCAETFLFHCYDLLKSKYEEDLKNIQYEIRSKLINEGTASWIRDCLLDMLLALNSGPLSKPERTTHSVAVQTERITDGDIHPRMLYADEQQYSLFKYNNDRAEIVSSSLVLEDTGSVMNLPEAFSHELSFHDHLDSKDVSSIRSRKDIPKSIRNLPPRFIKKYLQGEAIMDAPFLSNATASDTVNIQHENEPEVESYNEADATYLLNSDQDASRESMDRLDEDLSEKKVSSCQMKPVIPIIEHQNNALKNDHEFLGDCETVNYKVSYKYTPQQLKDLNIYSDEPKCMEVLEKYNLLANPRKYEVEDKLLMSKQYSLGLTQSKEDLWSTRDSFRESDSFGSSVDPDPIAIIESTEGALSYDELMLNQDSSNFQDIANDVFNSTHSINRSGEDNETRGELWHDDSPGPNGDFLKPKKSCDSVGLSRKAKKKKSRGKPLDEFLQEQEIIKTVEENETEDPFSPEALQMYEELEKQGVGNEIEGIQGARVLMPSKIGSHLTSSSKRPSLFASVRSEQSSSQGTTKPWCPGQRFCTNCQSRSHVVYDCPEKTTRF